ncbi:GSCOCG00012091001-RA-CDS, partial [Cotesia congregata]
FAYNTARHDSTQFTPVYLNYGREVMPPVSLQSQKQGPKEEYDILQIAKTLTETYELVRINLAQAYDHQSKYYNKRHRVWSPQIGDQVCKREHYLSSAIDNFSSKLANKFTSGYTITQTIGP